MERNEFTIEQLNQAICTIESYQHVENQRDFLKLSEVLPLTLSILKSKRNDMEQEQKSTKFYAPKWVRYLLERLSNNDEPLSEIEYNVFKSQVKDLAMSDYKSAACNMYGYEAQYTTPQEISETICALKHYFRLI